MLNKIRRTLRVTGVSLITLLILGLLPASASAAASLAGETAEAFPGGVTTDEAAITVNDARGADDLTEKRSVYAGGMPFGVKLYSEGLIIIGFSEVEGGNGVTAAPAKDAGMKISDIIIAVNGKPIESAEEFLDIVENCDGASVRITYLRGEDKCENVVTPIISKSDGKYRTGMWLRDSTAGIGTVTFIIPQSGVFGGLGHGICDSETGMRIPLSRGITSNVKINGVRKGVAGDPGELQGVFVGEKTGTILKNTDNGVFGVFSSVPTDAEMFTVGDRSEVKEGEAYILCTVDDSGVQKYGIRISGINSESTGNKNFLVTVTDEALICKTGGIVQGMSGSPIIQNGKLIGAVTHVLINDPTTGYGIFIDNMFDAAS